MVLIYVRGIPPSLDESFDIMSYEEVPSSLITISLVNSFFFLLTMFPSKLVSRVVIGLGLLIGLLSSTVL